MKAIIITKYGLPNVLQLTELTKPSPKDDEVLVKIHAVSINDWDWGLMRGKPFVTRMLSGLFKPGIKIPGVDIAGQIEEIGSNIKKFQPGDDVFGDISESGFGGFAQYVCVKEKSIALKPADMPFSDAAAIPHASMLAIQGLIDAGKLKPGQKLLINGAGGGVGSFGVQIAKDIGVEVTGVDGTEKLDMMRDLGFDHVIDYKQEDFTKNGQLYDLILDAKTNRPFFHYTRALSPGGAYVTVGGSMPLIFQMLIMAPFISMIRKKKMSIVTLKPNKDLDYFNEIYQAGKIKPVIDGPYKLSETPEAFKLFGTGSHKGKIVISIESDALN